MATRASQREQAFTAAALVEEAGAAVVVVGTWGARVVVVGAVVVVVVVVAALLICSVARLEQPMMARQSRTRTENRMIGRMGDYWIGK